MGERKVLNKYYPPDFDPAKIPRRRQPKNQQIKVRMMLPMSIRCNTCGNYIYKGTKFNSRKEDVVGETYLGIQILRFYFKCSRCSAELTMKTDPQNSDYLMETGATRNFEPWRAADEALDDAKKKRDAEELGDAMRALENRTIDSKHEMDILAALDEMKSMRARHAGVGTKEMLEALKRTGESKDKQLAEEDEAVLRSVVFQNSSKFVRRIVDDDFDDNSELEDEDDFQQERKRSKVENHDKVEKTPSQASEILESSSESQSLKAKAREPAAAFTFRPKAVKFAIKPKSVKDIPTANGDKSIVPPGVGDASEPNVKTAEAESGEKEKVDGNGASARLALTALCSTYDSSSESD